MASMYTVCVSGSVTVVGAKGIIIMFSSTCPSVLVRRRTYLLGHADAARMGDDNRAQRWSPPNACNEVKIPRVSTRFLILVRSSVFPGPGSLW